MKYKLSVDEFVLRNTSWLFSDCYYFCDYFVSFFFTSRKSLSRENSKNVLRDSQITIQNNRNRNPTRKSAIQTRHEGTSSTHGLHVAGLHRHPTKYTIHEKYTWLKFTDIPCVTTIIILFSHILVILERFLTKSLHSMKLHTAEHIASIN